MCWEAVKNDYRALQYVPEQYRDFGMYLTAVIFDSRALWCVPEDLYDEICAELCI
jgi:hypothetical protein